MVLRPRTVHRQLMAHRLHTARHLLTVHRRLTAHRQPLVPRRVLTLLLATQHLLIQHRPILARLILAKRIPTLLIRTLLIRGRTLMVTLKAPIRIHGIRGGTTHRPLCRLRQNRRCDFAKVCDSAIPMSPATQTSGVFPAIRSKVMISRHRWFLRSRSFSVVRSLGISCRRMFSIFGPGRWFPEAICQVLHSARFSIALGKPIHFRPLERS